MLSEQSSRAFFISSILHFRLKLGKPKLRPDPDRDSIGSGHVKPPSCFRCHPRRWRHQSCCFHSKTGTAQKSSFRARITRDQTEADGNSDPGSLLNASTDELHVHPMGGVASMISSVVSHTANMAATTAGGRITQQPRNTFGKRNIKNQVNKFMLVNFIRLQQQESRPWSAAAELQPYFVGAFRRRIILI